MYAHLLTVRFDQVPPDRVDRLVEYFRTLDRPVYAALEPQEREEFQRLFDGTRVGRTAAADLRPPIRSDTVRFIALNPPPASVSESPDGPESVSHRVSRH